MPQPPFRLQLVDDQGVLVRTHAGGAHEVDLVETFVSCILARPVGYFTSTARVEQAIRQGITEALQALKVRNPYDVVE